MCIKIKGHLLCIAPTKIVSTIAAKENVNKKIKLLKNVAIMTADAAKIGKHGKKPTVRIEI